jgi:ribosomal protein S18 acetylase RimI-like enzyme
MTVNIERVTDVDAVFATLATLLEELHEHHQAWWPREFVPDWRQRWRQYLKSSAERCILIARDRGEPIGYVNGTIRRDPSLFVESFGYIDDAFVRVSERRHGVGAMMLADFEAWCGSKGIDEIRLGVVAENAIGLGFWRKSGFRPLAYTMTKRLPAP